MNTTYVYGIAPGPIPGIVALHLKNQLVDRVDVVQCSASIAAGVFWSLLGWAHQDDDVFVQVENSVVGQRADTASLHHEYASAAALHVGSRWVWSEMNAETVEPWATDARLEAAGLLGRTAGMRHARAAARQALFCAVHDAGLRDPASKNSAPG